MLANIDNFLTLHRVKISAAVDKQNSHAAKALTLILIIGIVIIWILIIVERSLDVFSEIMEK